MNPLHLIWIVPLCVTAGTFLLIAVIMAVAFLLAAIIKAGSECPCK